MKKTLCQLLCLSALALMAAEEKNTPYDLYSKEVRAALKGKESYVSLCDSVLTFQAAPGQKLPWAWRTVSLPLNFSSRKTGQEFSFRISGELKLLNVEPGKQSEGVILYLSALQNGKRIWKFFSGIPRYGNTEWIPFTGEFKLSANTETPVLLCGLNNVSGTFGIRNLSITETE